MKKYDTIEEAYREGAVKALHNLLRKKWFSEYCEGCSCEAREIIEKQIERLEELPNEG